MLWLAERRMLLAIALSESSLASFGSFRHDLVESRPHELGRLDVFRATVFFPAIALEWY